MFALASVHAVVPERSSAGAVRRPAGAAVRAGAVAERERRDDEIALPDVAHFAARFLGDADELVTDRPRRVGRLAAVIPEIGAANAAQDHADDGIGRFLDDGIRAFAELDGMGPPVDRGSHVLDHSAAISGGVPRSARRPPLRVGGPARIVRGPRREAACAREAPRRRLRGEDVRARRGEAAPAVGFGEQAPAPSEAGH